MRSSEAEDLYLIPTLVFGVLSVICDIYVVVSVLKLKIVLLIDLGFKQARLTHDYIFFRLIIWMSSTDVLFLIAYMSATIVGPQGSNMTCDIFAAINQFFSVLAHLWKLVLPCYLFYILKQNSLTTGILRAGAGNQSSIASNNRVYFGPDFVINLIILGSILTSGICTVIPLFSKHREYQKIERDYGGECWIAPPFQLMSYCVIILSVIFDIIAVFLSYSKYAETKNYTQAYLILVKRLMVWTIVYLSVRIFPMALELYDFSTDWKHARAHDDSKSDGNVYPYVLMIRNGMLVSTGIANGIVWYLIQRLKLNGRLSTQDNVYGILMHDNHDHHDVNNNNKISPKKHDHDHGGGKKEEEQVAGDYKQADTFEAAKVTVPKYTYDADEDRDATNALAQRWKTFDTESISVTPLSSSDIDIDVSINLYKEMKPRSNNLMV